MFGCPRNRVNFSRYIRIAGEESGTASTPVSGESRNSSVSIGNSCRENDSNRSLFVTGNSAGKKFGEARDWAGIFSGNSGYRARVLCRPAHEGCAACNRAAAPAPPIGHAALAAPTRCRSCRSSNGLCKQCFGTEEQEDPCEIAYRRNGCHLIGRIGHHSRHGSR